MNNLKLISLVALCALIFCACNNKGEYSSKYPTNKLAPNDPFAATMVGSQTFEIDPNTENFVEGEKGTVVLVPAGAFLDKNGNIPKGKITVELAEALTVEGMLLSNLTTTSDGKPLQSGGMLYLNATTESGEQLHVDATKPLYIEVPTENKVAGMQAYVGIRDSMGNMNWVDPKPIVNYLVKVDLKDLDFLPAGFYDTVKTNMPYRGHLEADKPLADSLYYSLAVNDGSHLTDGLKNTDMNESQYNRNKKIENGKYNDQSFDIEPMNYTPNDDYKIITVQENADSAAPCGINPASIKVLKSKKFANSFIATREFEERMRHIHQTCIQQLIDIYITNIGKNLWEADQAAYDYLKGINNVKAEVFKNFYEQKLTTIEGASKYADKLAKYYQKQLKKTEAKLLKIKNKEIKELKKENDKVEKVKEKYRKTLWKREKYRNTRYGWEWTDLGWVNIDKPVVTKEGIEITVVRCGATKVEITLKDDTDYDRIHSYVLILSLKSMYRLNTTDNKIFYGGSAVDHLLHLPCFEPVNIILIAYKGEQSYFAMAKESPVDQKIVLDSPAKLEAYSTDALKATLKKYNGSYAKENSIEKDLKFQFKFYKEQQRQQTLKSEQEFIQKLQRVRCSVCRSLKSETQALFENNCTSCHAVCDKILGPPLYKVQEREGRTMEWLISFTKNSAKMIEDGDPLAVRLYKENNGAVMSSFENLSDKEIKSIYAYIRQFDCSTDIGGN